MTDQQLDRLKIIYEEIWQITQAEGIPPRLDEARQRLKWLIDEIESERKQESHA